MKHKMREDNMKNKLYFGVTFTLLSFFNTFQARATLTCNCGIDGHESECCWEINDGVLTISAANGATNVTMKDYEWVYSTTSYPEHYVSTAPWAGQNATSLVVGEGISNIGAYAFIGESKITNISGMSTVTSIGTSSFNRVSGLSSLTIPDSVTHIDDAAFFHMTGLTDLTVPDSIEEMVGKRNFAENNGESNNSIKNLTISSDMLAQYLLAQGGFANGANINCTSGDCAAILSAWDQKKGTNYSSSVNISLKNTDGTTTVYRNGEIIAYKGKRIYTMEEATLVTGKKNKVMIKYK